MRITNVGLYSNGFEVANFSFRDPETRNPYVIQGMFGLDADEIVPKFYGFSTTSKTRQYDMTLAKREITLRIALIPQAGTGKTYSDLRDDLYRAIASSRDGLVQLRFNNRSATTAAISGFITKFEASLSTKQPEVQLTIKCTESMLKSMTHIDVDVSDFGTAFTISDYVSTAPHGITFEVKFVDDAPVFTIKDQLNPEWFFTVTPGIIFGGSNFKGGDSLIISSEHDNKQVYATRGSEVEQLADRVAVGSLWPRIFPGNNDFLIDVGPGSFTWTSAYYWSTYWGV